MAHYHVQIGYATKRVGTELGMTVEAFGPDEAEEVAKTWALDGHPARKWHYTKIREATASEIACGVFTAKKRAVLASSGGEDG